MSIKNYVQKILRSTAESYVSSELDLRFDIMEFLKRKLKEHGLKQKDLAQKLNMKPSQLNRILNSETNITIETIARVYHAFGCSPTIQEKTSIAVSNAIGTTDTQKNYKNYIIGGDAIRYKSQVVQ